MAVVAGLDDTSSLHAMPETIPWRAFRTPRGDLVLIEWLKRPNPNNVPRGLVVFPKKPTFAHRPSGVSFEDSFGSGAPGLDTLYAEFRKQKRAATIPAVAVHTTLLLHRLTLLPVLGIASDDDEWDFVCEADEGSIQKLRFVSDEEEFQIGPDGTIRQFDLPSQPRHLHQIATHEAARWSDEIACLFGFDSSVDRLELVEIDRCRTDRNSPTPTTPEERPFWKIC